MLHIACWKNPHMAEVEDEQTTEERESEADRTEE